MVRFRDSVSATVADRWLALIWASPARAGALGDASGETSWWHDPATGHVEMGVSEWLADELDEHDDPAERGSVPIDAYGSSEANRDMDVFAGAVADDRVASMLSRALPGSWRFRRFRDTLVELPMLREHWLRCVAADRERSTPPTDTGEGPTHVRRAPSRGDRDRTGRDTRRQVARSPPRGVNGEAPAQNDGDGAGPPRPPATL